MKETPKPAPGLAPTKRRLAGLAGATVGCSTLAAVLMLFAHASRMSWLPATPENLAAIQPCYAVQNIAGRHACVEAAIEHLRSRDRATHLAMRPAETDGADATRPPN